MDRWDYKLRWYIHNGSFDIGPFKSMTDAWRHRRDFGPKGWGIRQISDYEFIDTLYPPMSPEQDRWEFYVEQPQETSSNERAPRHHSRVL